MTRRVFVSATGHSLDDRRRQVKAAILREVSDAGFELQEFGKSGMAESLAWNFENVDRVMKRCVGAVVICFARWTTSEPQQAKLIGEYNHYEGAVALTYGLPVLLLAERGVQDRGVIWPGGGKTITYIPVDAHAHWVEDVQTDPGFPRRFAAWKSEIESRRDVFLGYCSQSKGLAAEIQIRLQDMKATVLNYAIDFKAGGPS